MKKQCFRLILNAPTAFAALLFVGAVPLSTNAQMVADPNAGAHRPTVVQTANGLPQVNITAPSAAGVSTNAYAHFGVPAGGAILNNSAVIVQTQQAGYVNGNPNLSPGVHAKIILNQVTGNLPSNLNGYLEVAGHRAEVVIANPNGIFVNGAGFINTSRATLATGQPVYGANGNLAGFNVTGGQISVQGAGLNASNVDQVDLIARAVSTNAAIYANRLNVVTGTNQVDRDTLTAAPIAGNGTAPGVSIDVGQLGGMYANRIMLVGTENGVGVSNRGVLAAQSGDLTLTTQGQLVLAGSTNASGNLTISARGGVDNSGTTYAKQGVRIDTAGQLGNRGSLAAQQKLNVTAASVSSTGVLAAGAAADGALGATGELSVTASGMLAAHGRNAAGGSATWQGGALDPPPTT